MIKIYWLYLAVAFFLLGVVAIFFRPIGAFIAPLPAFVGGIICLLMWSAKLRSRTWDTLLWLKHTSSALWRNRLWRLHLVGLAVFWVLNIFTLGIPGAGVLYAHVTFLGWLKFSASIPTGDNAWPAFIMTGIIWPLGFIFAHYATQARRRTSRIILYPLIVLGWGFLIAAAITQYKF